MSIFRLIILVFLLVVIVCISIPLQILCNIAGFKLKKLYPLFFYQMIKKITGININFDEAKLNKKNTGVLYIANHVSWFDIICLGTLLNARFIAKKEVSKMGIFGFLAKLSNTFFIDNENKNKIIEYNELIQKKLQDGENFIIFPEGTTSDGNGIKNFKSSMLECAFDRSRKINIQPISICYSKLNNIPMGIYLRRNIAWVGDTSMVTAMANFLTSGRITVDIIFHDLININHFENRKALAAYCEKEISNGLNQTIKIS
jgi:1-acyl-sn-glycerol-3-phosphate acyltransferase